MMDYDPDDPEDVRVRIEYWKPSPPKHITPCEAGDDDCTIIRVEVFGATGKAEMEFRREREPWMFDGDPQCHWQGGLTPLIRMLQAAHNQGRIKQAGIIRDSMYPFGYGKGK